MLKYPVEEIFSSVQGEGLFLGAPATFIRFFGCNLRCPWCDTKKTWNNYSDCDYLTTEEIVSKIDQNNVVLTGGEPCLQDLEPLIEAIRKQTKRKGLSSYFILETNGTLEIPRGIDLVECSPKAPKYEIHPLNEDKINEIKLVVDEDFTEDIIGKFIIGHNYIIRLQPCDYGPGEENEKRTQACVQKVYDLTMKYSNVFMGIQMHKIFNFR